MNTEFNFSVLGIGLAFADDEAAEAKGYVGCDMDSSLLSPRLRRRMSHATRLAISAGERACVSADVAVDTLPSVFASISGEIKVTDTLCRNIADDYLPVSPTQFHNSVHNTAAGYWSIMTKNKHASQAIGAGENTFFMGLLESFCQLHVQQDKVLLICYDESVPEPMMQGEQTSDIAVAFVLGKVGGKQVRISQSDQDLELNTKDWSAVLKALKLADAIKQEGQDILVSDSKSCWFAKVKHDA